MNTIRQEGRIFSEDYTAEGIVLDALVDIKVYHLVESYKVKMKNKVFSNVKKCKLSAWLLTSPACESIIIVVSNNK